MDDPIHVLAFEGASIDDLLAAKPEAVFWATIHHAFAPVYADVQIRLCAPPERVKLRTWKLSCEACRLDDAHWVRATLFVHPLDDVLRLAGSNNVPPELLALLRPWQKKAHDAAFEGYLEQKKVLAR